MVRIGSGSSVRAKVNRLGTWRWRRLEVVATTKVCASRGEGIVGSSFPRPNMVKETRSGNVDHLYASGVAAMGAKVAQVWLCRCDIAGRELERQHEEVAWRDKRGAWRRHRRRVTRMRTIAGASCWAKGQVVAQAMRTWSCGSELTHLVEMRCTRLPWLNHALVCYSRVSYL
uniref:Uncharacterized protein n=1 Tax=Oryza glaberrima TaxID=4538 RepID=I1P0X6_ORYGL